MKKHLALVLALVMVLTSFSFVSAAPDFADVEGTMYEDAVSRLELLDVLKGYPDGTFKPEGDITRAEFAAVAVRVRGLAGVAETATGLPSGFSDVPAWHWASGYVGTAGSMGIVNGVGNGLFAPDSLVKYEEAVTMIVRALGYEHEAQLRGGYPYGYLIVAEDIDLLDGVRSTQGTFASRGLVAMLTDNALEIPMMIQDGTGDWVVSGTDRTDEVTLLEKMGYEPKEGRVTAYSTSRDTITLAGEGTFDVAEDFDFYEVDGVEIKAWVDGDMVIAYKLNETVYFDAVEYDEDDEVYLYNVDDNFVVDSRAELLLDGLSADVEDFDADYAKVVINEDGDVIWAEGVTFDNFIVVGEVDDEVVVAFDDYDEEDLDGFLIVENGKTIAIDDVEEGDVVFVDRSEEFAVVYNSSEMGVVDRAYTDSFRLDGTTYDLALNAVYLEDGDMGAVTEVVLDEFVDEGAEIEVFFNFYGDVVLMSGSKGTAKTSTYGLVLEEAGNFYQNLRSENWYLALDGVNSEGADVSFDATKSVIGKSPTFYTDDNPTNDKMDDEEFVEGKIYEPAFLEVIKYTVDEDGDLTKLVKLEEFDNYSEEKYSADEEFKITDRYAGDYRLKSGTVFFLLNSANDEVSEVFTLEDADEYFEEVMKYMAYSEKDVYADYIVVYESDAAADIEEVGVVTKVKSIANDTAKELTINIEGKSYEFVVDNDESYTEIAKGDIVSFLINEEMDEIRNITADVTDGRDDIIGDETSGKFELVSLRDKQFELDTMSKTFELDDAVILDATGTTKSISFSDINKDDVVNVYYEGTKDTVFVKYLVVVDEAAGEAGDVTFDMTANSSAVVLGADETTPYGRTLDVIVLDAGISWTIPTTGDVDVTVNKALITVDGEAVKSVVSVEDRTPGTTQFKIAFETDVYAGETLVIEEGAIELKLTTGSESQIATVNAGEIVIELAN